MNENISREMPASRRDLPGAADNLLYTERGKLAALINIRTSVPEQKFKDYHIVVVVVAWK
ncbi:hypothetical protein [Desulfofundulus thermosubterraneus]|uniref:Uncharacterized protein n=1 Tax=Desulfofundulus thermosubterraneus DSM 16057 TaxID=1121432 RepID=A0A1M6FR25_9FIRM|nr:hypothetical protein [Desulfofundulus thermosubterraneus]SHJ00104.1 hypothetical protein SAMN02745219_01518 [Desulfofundulus thermosubterraneus DSM 16057]